MDEIIDAKNRVNEAQTKFIYFMISLNVSAIGFSVFRTIEKPLDMIDLILLGAIILFGLSVHSGLTYLKKYIQIKILDIKYQETILKYKMSKEQLSNETKDLIDSTYESSNSKAMKLFNYCQRAFYGGVTVFLIWHTFSRIEVA